MTYEQPAVNETEAAYVNPAAIQEIKDEFAGGALLYSDALNVWPFQTSVESFDELEPVLHYEEYFKNKAEKSVKILTENNLRWLQNSFCQFFKIILDKHQIAKSLIC